MKNNSTFTKNWYSKSLVLNISQTRQFLKAECETIPDRSHLFFVTKPLKVFKKVWGQHGKGAVASLIIPSGAIIHFAGDEPKCRASSAVCASIWASKDWNNNHASWENGHFISSAVSHWDPSFQYHKASQLLIDKALRGTPELLLEGHAGFIKPKSKFSTARDTCASGVHFFPSLGNALRY